VESVVALAWDMGLKRAPAGYTLDETWRTEPDCGVRFVLRTDEDTEQEPHKHHPHLEYSTRNGKKYVVKSLSIYSAHMLFIAI
jgi:hypothetical protein